MQTLEEEINQFVEDWTAEKLIELFKDIFPLCELYDADEKYDWVEDIVGCEQRDEIRLVRTAYLVSKIADRHAGKLAHMKAKYPKLWQRMEKVI